MAFDKNNDDPFVLWGAPLSVYTARVRSYLIKKQIPFIERFPSHPDFGERILPQLGLFVIPVLEKPNGELIQDTTIIINYLEEHFPSPNFKPSTPIQNLVSSLISAFGSEGMNQPSMHYRWSFMKEHGDYIRHEFARGASPARDRKQRLKDVEPVINLMTSHLDRLGINPDTIPAIETAYKDLLEKLETHFISYPYLLGNRPSMADFGLMTGLYAHLSRDPVPAALMKKIAPNVYRWTERMNLPAIEDGEFSGVGTNYPAGDEIPETLIPVLTIIFNDWGPELIACANQYNDWLDKNPTLTSGVLVSHNGERAVHPNLGAIEYILRRINVKRESYPHSLWVFQKTLGLAAKLQGDDQDKWAELLKRTGGEDLMKVKLNRPLGRTNNDLVIEGVL